MNPANTDLDESPQTKMEFSCPNGFGYGAICQLSCSDGNPVHGPTEISCQKNNTDTGYWWYGNVKPYCDGEVYHIKLIYTFLRNSLMTNDS